MATFGDGVMATGQGLTACRAKRGSVGLPCGKGRPRGWHRVLAGLGMMLETALQKRRSRPAAYVYAGPVVQVIRDTLAPFYRN